MSVVVFIMTEHADDVHDQFNQLRLKTQPELLRCVIRGKLQHLNRSVSNNNKVKSKHFDVRQHFLFY